MHLPKAIPGAIVCLVVACGASGAESSSFAGQTGVRASCPARGERVLAKSARALVVDPGSGPESDGGFYMQICDRRSRRRASPSVDADRALIDLRGAVVAAYGSDCINTEGYEPCPYTVGVANATTGAAVAVSANAKSPCVPLTNGDLCGQVHALVAGRTLSAVWTAADGAAHRVVVMGPSGSVRILASSPRISLRSLRRSRDGRSVSWLLEDSSRRRTRRL